MYSILILLIIILAPLPIMIKYMLDRKSAYRGIFEGILSAITVVTIVFMFSQIVTGVTIFERFDALLSNINMTDIYPPSMYEFFGFNDLDASELETAMNNIKEAMKISIPGSIIIWTSILAYFNFRIISWLLRKSGKEVSKLPPFKEFNLPKSAMLGSILIYFLSYLASNMGIIDKNLIMYSIQLLFSFIFSIQGLAVLFFYGSLKKVPNIVLIIIAAILLSTEIGKTVLFIIGLTDIAFDIRKRLLLKQGSKNLKL